MATIVYVLCAATSTLCAGLLARSWLASRVRLLLWSALCFAGLAVNNLLLFTDKVIAGNAADLSVARSVSALIAVCVLLFGLVWETR
jgi:hypothetical protein